MFLLFRQIFGLLLSICGDSALASFFGGSPLQQPFRHPSSSSLLPTYPRISFKIYIKFSPANLYSTTSRNSVPRTAHRSTTPTHRSTQSSQPSPPIHTSPSATFCGLAHAGTQQQTHFACRTSIEIPRVSFSRVYMVMDWGGVMILNRVEGALRGGIRRMVRSTFSFICSWFFCGITTCLGG